MRRLWIAGVLLVLAASGLAGYTVFSPWKSAEVAKGTQTQNKAPAGKDQKAKSNTHFHASNISDNDLKLMANAVYGEARGEPYQ